MNCYWKTWCLWMSLTLRALVFSGGLTDSGEDLSSFITLRMNYSFIRALIPFIPRCAQRTHLDWHFTENLFSTNWLAQKEKDIRIGQFFNRIDCNEAWSFYLYPCVREFTSLNLIFDSHQMIFPIKWLQVILQRGWFNVMARRVSFSLKWPNSRE